MLIKLCDQKYRKKRNIVKYYCNLNISFYFNMLSNIIYYFDKSCIFSIITPFFSATCKYYNIYVFILVL